MMTFHRRSIREGAHTWWMDERQRHPFDGLRGDIRFALRVLNRARVYGVASALTLALGIGATTAVFSVVDATMIRPLPYRQPDRLAGIAALGSDADGSLSAIPPSQIELVRWRDG